MLWLDIFFLYAALVTKDMHILKSSPGEFVQRTPCQLWQALLYYI